MRQGALSTDGGRSGGFRTIVLFRRGGQAFFMYGFAKSASANLRRNELAACRLPMSRF